MISKDKTHKIDEQTERRIKEAADIVDVVGDFVELKREGENLTGLCPFHDDRHTGSFFVSPRRNICRCFACDVTHDPVGFLMSYGQGMRYNEALCYLAAKYGIPVDNAPSVVVQKAEPRKEREPLPMLELPREYVIAKLSGRVGTPNPLRTWLLDVTSRCDNPRALPYWMERYGMGTSTAPGTEGWTIWWQIDEQKRVRTGKMMKYNADGHRSHDKYATTFVHHTMKKAHMYDPDKCEVKTCLFGLHLLNEYPEAEVCIVESEKSAVIAQSFATEGKKIFMATGSKGVLNERMLQPLMEANRDIVLYPDVDGMREWRQRAKALNYPRIWVSGVVMKHYDPRLDSPKADIADILVRIVTPQRAERNEHNDTQKLLMAFGMQEHKGLEILSDKLNLEIIRQQATI